MRKIVAFAVAALFPLAGWADILITRSGATHNGRFISGNNSQIVFQDDNGARRTYNTGEVQSIQFQTMNPSQGAYNNGGYNNRPVYNTDGAMAGNQNVDWSRARSIPAGTNIVVRTSEAIDSTSANEGQSYPAVVSQDILDPNGNVIVPRGSDAELVVRNVNQGGTAGSSDLVLDLQSMRIGNQRYLVSSAPVTQSNQEGLGKNKRTAEMVGGGALLGTILGAVAGGGTGAAIGAVAGAAAGAGVQVLTRGKKVKVPAETQLTFQLQNPINLVPQRQ